MTIALMAALIDFSLNHYVWSFQRFTLGMARSIGNGVRTHVTQASMTPVWMGTIGWLNYVTLAIATYLLWVEKSWIWSIGYLFFRFVIATFLPLLPLNKHYYRIVRAEQLANLLRPPI